MHSYKLMWNMADWLNPKYVNFYCIDPISLYYTLTGIICLILILWLTEDIVQYSTTHTHSPLISIMEIFCGDNQIMYHDYVSWYPTKLSLSTPTKSTTITNKRIHIKSGKSYQLVLLQEFSSEATNNFKWKFYMNYCLLYILCTDFQVQTVRLYFQIKMVQYF